MLRCCRLVSRESADASNTDLEEAAITWVSLGTSSSCRLVRLLACRNFKMLAGLLDSNCS
jgi:hypothetical protein